jgi:hypothetical protein
MNRPSSDHVGTPEVQAQQERNCWKEYYLCGPCRDVIYKAGSNTSTVNLRVAGGDEKESLESETVKYGCERLGTRSRK